MSKLLKLKEWVGIDEAATYLSTVLDEDVKTSDVLRLALDGQMVLSVRFVGEAEAIRCQIVPREAAPRMPGLTQKADGSPHEVILGRILPPDGAKVMVFDEGNIKYITGIWDLPMIGQEAINVEDYHQLITGGPLTDMTDLDGAFVQNSKGEMYALQQRVRAEGTSFQLYPGPIPENAVYVLRTTELLALQSRFSERPASEERDLSTTERNTLLKLVIGMAVDGYGYDHRAARSPIPKQISDGLASLGINLTDDTIRKWLREGANAFLSRTGSDKTQDADY